MLYAQWDLDEYVAVQSREAEERGELKKALTVAKKLLGKDMPIEDVADATGLSIEDVENLIIA